VRRLQEKKGSIHPFRILRKGENLNNGGTHKREGDHPRRSEGRVRREEGDAPKNASVKKVSGRKGKGWGVSLSEEGHFSSLCIKDKKKGPGGVSEGGERLKGTLGRYKP